MKAPLWMVLATLSLPAVPLAAQTSPPQTRVIECGTDSRDRQLCAAGGRVASAKLVRDLSFDRCNAAGSWGWTDNAVWADNACRGEFEVTYARASDSAATRRITCGTLSRRRYECSTEGVADSVRVVRRSTFARCTEGTNWGHSDSLIWAGNGCRAEFEVVYRRASTTPAGGPAEARTRTILCGKSSGELHTCELDGQADTVRLLRELNGDACRQRFNWGYTRSFVWAKSGCRGLFAVTYVDTATAAPSPVAATRRITCGSGSAIEVQCRVGGHASEARVLRNLGTSECRRNENWRLDDDVILAGRGCRAEFEVTVRSDSTQRMKPMAPAHATRVVSCGDARGSAMSCNAFGTVATARVLRDRSAGRCSQGSSWGIGEKSIWVARGCFADFELRYTTTPKSP